jgi:DNA-binding GntR family transcriptional regulator
MTERLREGIANPNLSADRLGPLSAESGVPRYRQIADQLARLAGGVPPGVRLPSEHEIAAHLKVSRATATQALRELEQRGVIYRRQGSGSFTTDPNRAVRSTGAGRLPSFSDDLRRAGHRTSERLVSCTAEPAPPEVAAALSLPPHATPWRVERVIVSDGEPVVHVTSWLPAALYPDLSTAGLATSSLYELLGSAYGADGRPTSADEQWRAQTAPRATAALLDLPSRPPVMRVDRLAYRSDGTPAEYAVSYVRGDTFVVSIHIRESAPMPGSAPQLQADGP